MAASELAGAQAALVEARNARHAMAGSHSAELALVESRVKGESLVIIKVWRRRGAIRPHTPPTDACAPAYLGTRRPHLPNQRPISDQPRARAETPPAPWQALGAEVLRAEEAVLLATAEVRDEAEAAAGQAQHEHESRLAMERARHLAMEVRLEGDWKR